MYQTRLTLSSLSLSPIRFSLPFPEKLSPAVGRRMEEEEKEEDLIYLKLVRFHTFPRQEGRRPRAIFPAVACFSFGASSGRVARSPRDNTSPAILPLHDILYLIPVNCLSWEVHMLSPFRKRRETITSLKPNYM